MAAVIAFGLLVMAALVIYLGSWFVTDRHLQQGADASALAGVEYIALVETQSGVPTSNGCGQTSDGVQCAKTYAGLNKVGLDSDPVFVFSNQGVKVKVKETVPGFGVGFLNIASTRRASATAVASPLTTATDILPFAVDQGQANWRSGSLTTLKFTKSGTGDFDLLDLGQPPVNSSTCGFNTPGIANCINTLCGGCSATISTSNPSTDFPPAKGAKFNSVQIKDAVNALAGKTVLVPIYSSLDSSGNYIIVGFGAFQLATPSPFSAHGTDSYLTGTFEKEITSVTGSGTIGASCSGPTFFGVCEVSLVQ